MQLSFRPDGCSPAGPAPGGRSTTAYFSCSEFFQPVRGTRERGPKKRVQKDEEIKLKIGMNRKDFWHTRDHVVGDEGTQTYEENTGTCTIYDCTSSPYKPSRFRKTAPPFLDKDQDWGK